MKVDGDGLALSEEGGTTVRPLIYSRMSGRVFAPKELGALSTRTTTVVARTKTPVET